MKVQILKKTSQYIKRQPNLKNHEQKRRSFNWNEAKKEIDFIDGKLNAAYNAVERNANNWRKNKVAMYWEGNEDTKIKFTFKEINDQANKFANLLHELEVEKGDRVFFFLPRLPELYYGFLGTLKRGAIAGTLFSAFGPQAIQDRLENSAAKVLVTTDELLLRVLKIIDNLPHLETILVVDSDKDRKEKQGNAHILSFKEHFSKHSKDYKTRMMDPEDPAFMLYTSGTTGKPKGVIHAHRAILHEHMSAKWVLDLQEDDVYWCTADPGWVTGIAYEILGSWSNGASSVIYAGRFSPEKWYQIIQDYKVTVWYTAPTAIRMLAADQKKSHKKFNFTSLRHLASVGEPLNPEPIRWGLRVFGLPFHDNWWQTETGGILIANYPSMDIKLGSMGKPLPGIIADIIDEKGNPLGPNKEGDLAIRPGWPSMMKQIWRRPKKYKSYFTKGWYISGDRAFKDKDGYFWFVGRADDVIKTAGERVGPFEVESALVEHPAIIEAGVIGKPDKLRGEIIKAFVTLASGIKPSEKLKDEIKIFIKSHLAGHAYPREIEFRSNLPKTRSGKIMRRMLKAQELGLPIGDTSTLAKF